MEEKKKGENPIMTGSVSKNEDGVMVKVGRVSLWENSSENEKAPKYRGAIELGEDKNGRFVRSGQERSISLWPFKPKQGAKEEGDL